MAPPVSDPRPKPTNEDRLRYLEALMEEFAWEREKFEEVLAVICAFNDGRMDVAAVIAWMEDLLSGHTELLHEFNRFLPWGYMRTHGPIGGNID